MLVASALSVALALFHVYVVGFETPESHSFRSTHLAVMMVLAFLIYPMFRASVLDSLTGKTPAETTKRKLEFTIDLLLVSLVIAVQAYVLFDVEEFQAREGSLDPSDVWMSSILVFLVLETTRRAVGWTMFIITGFFIVQTLYSNHFLDFSTAHPSILRNLSMSSSSEQTAYLVFRCLSPQPISCSLSFLARS